MSSNIGWIILNCATTRTLALAAALIDAGFEAWAPAEVLVKKRPRSTVLREVTAAMTPGYVFAPADRRVELQALSWATMMPHLRWDPVQRRMVNHGLPHFRVFHHHGGCPVIADASLSALRAIEERLRLATERRRAIEREQGPVPRFEAGQVVRVGGAFEGMDLVVVEPNKGKMVALQTPDWTLGSLVLTISAWGLQEAGNSAIAGVA